ncbi:MAG: cation diffusion facilitator family transporter [Desulfobacterales bacterium]|jgi:cation diffusion facilitator family transporter|nr:cation diffusion facilitator family transporter [Desulfobacterales bacterium]
MKNNHAMHMAARLAFITSLALLLAKFGAYYLTDSKAVFSDAIESIINVVTAAFLMLSISVSSKPVDEDHPYGHGKIESFSAGLEGGLIILAAIMILVESIPVFFAPQPPRNLGLGLYILGGAGAVNLVVGGYLMRAGRTYKSEAISADGRHLLTDFYTSAGVIIGLLLYRLTGFPWLDPLVACLVALNILIPGISLLAKSFKNLMDEADPELLERIVLALNTIKKPGWLYPHKLRALRSGRYHHVDLHISLPHYWTLTQVHEAEQEITQALLDALGEEGDIMIHVDPCEPPYCPICNVDKCSARKAEFNSAPNWSVKEVISARAVNNNPLNLR